MKTIGLLGGMSWESTVPYYQMINRGVNARLGGLHSADIILYSLNFEKIQELQHSSKWEKIAEILTGAARKIEAVGADFLVICSNTVHKVAGEIEKNINIPILHIADAAAEKIKHEGFNTVGLLGTKFTMEQDFYKGRLRKRHNIETIIPPPADRKIVHRVIYDELCRGKIEKTSRLEYLRIIRSLGEKGAQAVILGCTEIALLIRSDDTSIPLLNTTEIHAQAAVELALV